MGITAFHINSFTSEEKWIAQFIITATQSWRLGFQFGLKPDCYILTSFFVKSVFWAVAQLCAVRRVGMCVTERDYWCKTFYV